MCTAHRERERGRKREQWVFVCYRFPLFVSSWCAHNANNILLHFRVLRAKHVRFECAQCIQFYLCSNRGSEIVFSHGSRTNVNTNTEPMYICIVCVGRQFLDIQFIWLLWVCMLRWGAAREFIQTEALYLSNSSPCIGLIVCLLPLWTTIWNQLAESQIY